LLTFFYFIFEGEAGMAVVTTVRLTKQEYQKIKKLVEKGLYLSISDFIRTAVRELLNKYYKKEEGE